MKLNSNKNNPKDLLMLVNNSLIFKQKTEKKPISKSSLILLAKGINSVIEANSNILISIEGVTQNQYISKIACFLQQQGHKIYEFDKHISIPLMVDEFVVKNEPIDYLIKISISVKNKFVKVQIKDKNFENLNEKDIEEITQIYDQNPVFNIDYELQPFEQIEYKKYCDLLTSKEQILKPFLNIKQRYLSTHLLSYTVKSNSKILEKLLINNGSEDTFKTTRKAHSFKFLKFLTWFNKRRLLKRNINNIFHIDELSELNVGLLINNKYRFLNSNFLALLYLDFYLEEYKRGKVDVSQFKILIPYTANYAVKDLLSQYHIEWEYFDENTYRMYKDDKNFVFAYTENNFIPNPKYSLEFNNYYFFACLQWMLNSYVNRNNLLSFRYNKLIENFGVVKTKHEEYKLQPKNIKYISSFIRNLYNGKKDKQWAQMEVIEKWDNGKYYLFRVETIKKHEILIYYDFYKSKICVDLKMCMIYEYRSNYSFLDHSNIQFKIWKITNNLRNYVKKQKKIEKQKQKMSI
ncbi:MAG5620 family putative phospho-sugar mutase [Mycoplasma sp. HS2188]|uniref:MAG5620 family putative phospho-sugar mutase n=1 Tax=Mycoplasma sp. HS2188 TaxID=2976765 RepID=UPI0021AA2EE3|nr:hypothetical protein [Mycoplasma sp. HS2188]MCT4469447.1 hypothetical protein [Mycoplasma sp. HS2188]